MDTSLTVGEAAAIFMNYERRTGDTLKHWDLCCGTLQKKLIPSDYDIKGQVSTSNFSQLSLFPIDVTK